MQEGGGDPKGHPKGFLRHLPRHLHPATFRPMAPTPFPVLHSGHTFPHHDSLTAWPLETARALLAADASATIQVEALAAVLLLQYTLF